MAWLNGWTYRKAITITEQSGSDLTDYQVKIELNSSNFDFSKANADGSDIRFAADDGTLLPYWIEEWDSVNQTAKIWVKIPSLLANSSITIYMYYGNPSAVSESNGEAVFDFFDDFNNTDLDLNKWAAFASGGNYSVANSYVTLSPVPNKSNAVALRSNAQFTNDIIVEAKVNPQSDTCYDLGLIKTGDIITSTWHLPGGGDLGYAFRAQEVTRSDRGYYLAKRTASGFTMLKRHAGGGQTLQEIIYKLTYTAEGKLIGQVEFLDGTIWLTLQVTDTTYLSDNKYIVIWQGEYSSGLGGPSSWDWVRVRKYASVEPSVSIGVEETSGGASYFEAITDQVVIFEQYVRSSYYTQTVSDDLFISDANVAAGVVLNVISESLFLSEIISSSSSLRKVLSESIGLFDNYTKTVNLFAVCSDDISLADTLQFGGAVLRALLTDAISVFEESISKHEAKIKNTEILSLDDAISLISVCNVLLYEGFTLDEKNKRDLQLLLLSALNLSDNLAKYIEAYLFNKDKLNLNEDKKELQQLFVTYSDLLNLNDELRKLLGLLFKENIALIEVYAFTFAVNLITDILLSEATDKTAGIKERLIELLNLNEILPFQYWRGEAIPVKLLSQIIAVKLLNSDIETIKEIYSLISNVKRLGGD